MTRSHALLMLATIVIAATLAFGQGQAYHPLGIDLAGYWSQFARQQDVGLGTAAGELGDYGGVPISEAGRLSALAWSASRLTLPQHQCVGYVTPYVFYGPGYFRVWEERDPQTQELIAIKMRPYAAMPDRTIWMDGRPHPPAYAQHTWAGFSTGKYEGNILTVYTTHIKKGQFRANGLAQSDQATVVEHFIRHGERMTYFSVVNDPVNLDEPFPKTSNLVHVRMIPTVGPCPAMTAKSFRASRRIASITISGVNIHFCRNSSTGIKSRCWERSAVRKRFTRNSPRNSPTLMLPMRPRRTD